jgi:hypothetical protein
VLPNNAENIVRWIEDPQGVDDSEAWGYAQDAIDIAAYLYSTK